MRFNVRKNLILTYLLYAYIGGFSFFIGVGTSILNIPVYCVFISCFIGNYVFKNIIMVRYIEYRYTPDIIGFTINVILSFISSSLIIYVGNYLYNKEIISFLIEPFTFGFLYGFMYLLIIKVIFKNKLFNESSFRP